MMTTMKLSAFYLIIVNCTMVPLVPGTVNDVVKCIRN